MKLKLNDVDMEDDFFADTTIIGIVSGMPAYRLCWVLNQHFDLDFRRDHDMKIELKIKDNITTFPVYQYTYPNSPYRHLLYRLKADNISLLPEIGKIDYIWLVQTAEYEEDARAISAELKKIPEILLSQIFERSQLKSLKNLMF